MDDRSERQPVFRNLGLGILMAVALAVGLQSIFEEAWIAITLGVLVGLVLFGGLQFRRD